MSMSSNGTPSRRSLSLTNISGSMRRASESGGGGVDSGRKSLSGSRSMGLTGERTVRRLRLSRALTMSESTSIREACRKMAARKVDALLLTDSNALLSGILTDKDITMKVIAQELHLDETPVSKVMTRNPTFVLSDTLAVEALQKMVQGRFRHLPVVENGEVIALLDIAKCLHDAIARMERAAEKGKAIAAAVEGVEKNWGTSLTVPNAFIETIRERMFRPTLSTIAENSKVVTISPEETVLVAAKKMLEFQSSSAVVAVNNKPQGILTSKDLLMRVVAQDLPVGSTAVEKVMTRDPECATVDTPVVDALNIMHNGKFLHLPVVDRERNIVAVVDVLHVTHAAVATVGTAVGGESASATMQKFWDSAMALSTVGDDDDNRSESSFRFPSEVVERSPSYPSPSPSPSSMPNLFSFKIQDKHGRMHRFTCNTRTLTDVIACIIQRVGGNIDRNNLPQIMYEDEDGDRVVLASDSDLTAALEHARLAGWKGLRLHLDYSKRNRRRVNTSVAQSDAWGAAYSTVAAGAAVAAGYGIFVYLKRNGHLPS